MGHGRGDDGYFGWLPTIETTGQELLRTGPGAGQPREPQPLQPEV